MFDSKFKGLLKVFIALIIVKCSVIDAQIRHSLPKPYLNDSNDNNLVEKWSKSEDKLMKNLAVLMRGAMPQLMKAQGEMPNVSSECIGTIMKVFNSVMKLKTWPFQMADSGTRLGPGFLLGANYPFGSKEECLDVRVPKKNGAIQFEGQYCIIDMVSVGPPRDKNMVRFGHNRKIVENFTVKTELMGYFKPFLGITNDFGSTFGLCLPSTCSLSDLDAIMETVSQPKDFILGIVFCEDNNSGIQLTKVQIVTISVLSFFMVMVIIATIFDLITTKPSEKEVQEKIAWKIVLLSFSFPRNVTKLLSTKGPSDTTLSSFNGMRFCSMAWVILCHAALFIPPIFNRRPLPFAKNIANLFMMDIFNGFVTVDSFIYLTSVLTSYLMTKALQKYSSSIFIPSALLIKRIFRMYPMMLLAVSLHYLLQAFNYGPGAFSEYEIINESCRKYVWSLFIFMQNYLVVDSLCVGHLWYICADLHLFVAGLIYIKLYIKNTKIAYTFSVFFMLLGIFTTAGLVIVKQWPMVIFQYQPDIFYMFAFFKDILLGTHAHTAVYGYGLLVGTYLANKKENPKISKPVEIIGWLVCAFCILFPTHCFYFVYHGYEPSLFESALYSSSFRFVWAIGLSWITIMCAIGKADLLNRLLSWKGFIPLNRPSFMMYLIHYQIMWFLYSNRMSHVDTSGNSIVWFFFGYLLSVYIVATILHLCVECPVVCISQMCTYLLFGYLNRLSGPPKKGQDEVKEKKDTQADRKA